MNNLLVLNAPTMRCSTTPNVAQRPKENFVFDHAGAPVPLPIPHDPGVPLHPKGIPIEKVPAGSALSFWCLSPRILASEVHWEFPQERKGRDRPCMGKGRCPFCAQLFPVRWIGWVGGLIMPRRAIRVIPLTRHAVAESKELREANGHLRGRAIVLERDRPEKQAAVRAKLVLGAPDFALPPEPSLEDALGALWGMTLDEVSAWKTVRRAQLTPEPIAPTPEEEKF